MDPTRTSSLWLVGSTSFVALCATGLVAASIIEVGQEWATWSNWPCYLLMFCATSFVYIFDRVAPTSPEDEASHHTGLDRLWQDRVLMGVMGITGIGAAVALVALSSWMLWGLLLPMALLTFGYSLPLLPKGKRLKDIPGLKIFLIALIWALATEVVPVLWVTKALPPAPLFVMRALFILAITLPFDLRDAEQDKRHGVKTLPHLLGWRGTKMAALGLLGVVVVLAWWSPLISTGSFRAIATITAFNAVIVAIASEQRGRWYYAFWCEGTMGFYALALALANA